MRPRKSGTSISTRIPGLNALVCRTHSAKCAAPPSRTSSRSTEVITTYFSAIARIASANWRGSSTSRGLGRPCATSQNGQRRVQISPMIINVAVPPPKHSLKFGHAASSQTVLSLCSRKIERIRLISGDEPILARIHGGLRGSSSVVMIFTGMREVLSAPRSFSPCTTLRLAGVCRSVLDGVVSVMVAQNLKNGSTNGHHLC